MTDDPLPPEAAPVAPAPEAPNIKKTYIKSSGRFLKYNLWWPHSKDPLAMELDMIRVGGVYKRQNGEEGGNGLFYHYRRFQEIAWPEKIWEKGPFKNYWAEKCLQVYLDYVYIGAMGCAGCVRGDTKILDPITGESPTIKSLCDSGTRPTVMTAFGPARSGVPFVKGVDKLYEVTTSSGRKFTATSEHLVLLTTGVFCRVADLQCGNSILIAEPAHLGSTWEHAPSTHALDGLRFWQTAPDSQFDCQPCSYYGDAPLHVGSAACSGKKTSLSDALERMFLTDGGRLGGRDNKPKHIHPYQLGDLLSTHGFDLSSRMLGNCDQPRSVSGMGEHGVRPLQPHDISVLLSNLQSSFSEPMPGFFHRLNSHDSYPRLWVARDAVSSINFAGVEKFYDLQVPFAHHYYAEGFLHHNSGKSDSFGGNVLTDWYAHADCTTVLVSSTDLKSLELRIWGMIKKYHRSAKADHNWLPGFLIEGKQMLTLNPKEEAGDGRDFKNGIIAVACKKGSQFVGLGPLIGIHNKRVRLLADECNLMPRAFLDSASNLSKCQDFKLVGLGNPNETTNAHGFLCEPSMQLGGWEGGADQEPGTKTWETKFPRGICIQLPGSDSPNMQAQPGDPPPFPFLITRQQMLDDAAIWGKDDWHYTMMNEAKMPRGQGSRRVLTRQSCLKHGAFNEPNFRDSRLTKIAFLDAAYRGVGGDRCIFGELNFGQEIEPQNEDVFTTSMISQSPDQHRGRIILALIDLVQIPLKSDIAAEPPEDQIVQFVMKQCQGRGISAENFFYDAGMRTSLVQAFSRLWDVRVNSIDCGGKPSETMVSSEIQKIARDYYSKYITELWFNVRLAVESGQFRGMTDEVVTEFSQREWKMVSGNRIEVESKEDMKIKTGRSPDLADAVAIGVQGARLRGFVISRLATLAPKSAPNGPDWRKAIKERARKIATSGLLTYK